MPPIQAVPLLQLTLAISPHSECRVSCRVAGSSALRSSGPVRLTSQPAASGLSTVYRPVCLWPETGLGARVPSQFKPSQVLSHVPRKTAQVMSFTGLQGGPASPACCPWRRSGRGLAQQRLPRQPGWGAHLAASAGPCQGAAWSQQHQEHHVICRRTASSSRRVHARSLTASALARSVGDTDTTRLPPAAASATSVVSAQTAAVALAAAGELEDDLAGAHRLLREKQLNIKIPEVDEEPCEQVFQEQEAPPSGSTTGCPVYVMLPLDTVWVIERDGSRVSVLKKERSLEIALHTLKQAGVEGVMVDVWWGIAERAGPRCYDFTAYKSLFHKVRRAGLKVQAVMSFHAAGGNVGDTCKIPLPKWVLDIGEKNPDIYYTDKSGHRNKECLSLGCDVVPLFWGRTPVDVYRDFMDAFCDEFQHLFGTVLTEITVGLGPAGELRFPSYPEGDGRWRFPGVGEFQCYDKYMLEDLKRTAEAVGHPEWGLSGPHDAGHYNSSSWETGFFISQGGSWSTPYGHFFLSWYSGLLVKHAERVLSAAQQVLNKHGRPRIFRVLKEATDGHVIYEFQPACKLGMKLAGVHWWFKSRAHAAELTAGYYNTRDRNGYEPVIQVLRKTQSRLSFTCVEMRDCEHPPEGRCSPQALLQQVIECAEAYGVPLAGENALQRYDDYAFERIAESAFGRSARAGRLEQVTFLRMGDLMFDNWDAFSRFLNRMRCKI